MNVKGEHNYAAESASKRTKYSRDTYCSVPQCSNYRRVGISFHKFPLKRDKIVAQWTDVLKLGGYATTGMNVCGEHFTDEDYELGPSELKRLKMTAIPSRKLPISSHDIVSTEKQSQTEKNQIARAEERRKTAQLAMPTMNQVEIRRQEGLSNEPLMQIEANRAVQKDEDDELTAEALLHLRTALREESLATQVPPPFDAANQAMMIDSCQESTSLDMIKTDADQNSFTDVHGDHIPMKQELDEYSEEDNAQRTEQGFNTVAVGQTGESNCTDTGLGMSGDFALVDPLFIKDEEINIDCEMQEQITEIQVEDEMEFLFEELPDDRDPLHDPEVDQVNGRVINIRCPWSCNKCPKAFVDEAGLLEHNKLHTNVMYQCDQCELNFNSMSLLSIHRDSHFCSVRLIDIMAKTQNETDNDCPHLLIDREILDENVKNNGERKNLQTASKRFHCTFCERSFSKRNDFYSHIIQHPVDGLYKCIFCPETYNKLHDLRNHTGIHPEHRRHQCEFCERSFYKKKELHKHIFSHPADVLKKCEVGTDAFNLLIDVYRSPDPSSSKLFLKQLNSHSLKKFNCEFCQKSYHQKSRFRKHILSHPAEMLKKCKAGTEAFNLLTDVDGSTDLLSSTLFLNQQNCPLVQKFNCEFCEKSYHQKKRLHNHILNHPPEELYNCKAGTDAFNLLIDVYGSPDPFSSELFLKQKNKPLAKQYNCGFCKRSFTKRKKFYHHVIHHPVDGLYKCIFCPETYKRFRDLRNHTGIHPECGRYKCEFCKNSFNKKERLQKHILSHPAEVLNQCKEGTDALKKPSAKEYNCTFCEQSFSTRKYFYCHIIQHPVDGWYKCIFCTETYNYFSDLRNHAGIHPEYGKLKCEFCEKSYHLKKGLHKHILNHPAELLYNCEAGTDAFNLLIDVYGSPDPFSSELFLKQKNKPAKKYNCTFCKRSFTKRELFYRHVIQHPVDGLYKCNLCPETFQGIKNLRGHTVIHPEHGHLKCTLCEKYFVRKSALDDHTLSHKVDSLSAYHPKSFLPNEDLGDDLLRSLSNCFFKCNLCTETFKLVTDLRIHMANHPEYSQYKCTFCEQCFQSKKEIQCHVIKHPVDGLYKCDLCSETFQLFTDLSTHRSTHPEHTTKRRFNCKFCEKSFDKKKDFNSHVIRHPVDGLFKCNLCPETFKLFTALRDHRNIHPEVGKALCEVCGKRLPNFPKLEIHMRVHAVNDTEPLTEPSQKKPNRKQLACDLCPKTFLLNYNLIKHRKSHDVTRKIFKCEICDYPFVSAWHLKSHSEKHSLERPYKCSTCNLGFKRVKNMTFHAEQMHNPENEFACDMCSNRYPSSSRLDYHKKRDHNLSHKKRPFKCKSCHLTYCSPQGLKIHVSRKHSDDCNLTCDLCNGTFTSRTRLKSHLKIYHKKIY